MYCVIITKYHTDYLFLGAVSKRDGYFHVEKDVNIAILRQFLLKKKKTKPKMKKHYLFTTQSRLLTTLGKKPFENIVGKGENAGNQHFLLLPQCFQLYQRQKSLFNPLRDDIF